MKLFDVYPLFDVNIVISTFTVDTLLSASATHIPIILVR